VSWSKSVNWLILQIMNDVRWNECTAAIICYLAVYIFFCPSSLSRWEEYICYIQVALQAWTGTNISVQTNSHTISYIATQSQVVTSRRHQGATSEGWFWSWEHLFLHTGWNILSRMPRAEINSTFSGLFTKSTEQLEITSTLNQYAFKDVFPFSADNN
jgi:hypothetical protein